MIRLILIFSFLWPLLLPARLIGNPHRIENTGAEGIQAQVGTQIITSVDVKKFQRLWQAQLVPRSPLDSLYSKKRGLKNPEEILRTLLSREIISQQIPPEFPPVKEKDFQQEWKALQKVGGKKALLRKIQKAGWSLGDYQDFVRESLRMRQFLELSLMSKVSVSDQDIESAYLNQYKKPLFQEFEYEFLTVFFTEEEKASVIDYLKKNPVKDLNLLASELSLESKKSKIQGSQIKSEIKQQLDKLSVSQVSPILLINSMYYLLQIQWKSPLISTQERSKKQKIEKNLYEMAFNRELEEWIKEQKKQVYIKSQWL